MYVSGQDKVYKAPLYDKLDVLYEEMVEKVLECFMEGVNSASVNNVNAVNAGDENSIPTLCVNAFALCQTVFHGASCNYIDNTSKTGRDDGDMSVVVDDDDDDDDMSPKSRSNK